MRQGALDAGRKHVEYVGGDVPLISEAITGSCMNRMLSACFGTDHPAYKGVSILGGVNTYM